MKRELFKKGDILMHQSSRSGYDHVIRTGELCIATHDEEPGILSGKENNYIRIVNSEGKKAAAHATRFKLILRGDPEL